jgi:PPP family 3-phenylpropionic acid transporter
MSVLPLAGLASPPMWGQLADRSGERTRILALVTLGSAAGYALLALPQGFAGIAAATAAAALFSSAVVPLCTSVSLAALQPYGSHAFGRARVWGTLGFLAAVSASPWLLDRYQARRGLVAVTGGPSEPGLGIMFAALALLCALAAAVALAIPRRHAVVTRAARGDWRRLFAHGPFLRALAFSALAFLFLQGPISLFPLLVRAHGGGLETVSHLWVLMVLLEIPLVTWSGATLARLGPRGLLAIGTLAGGVRWIACGLAPDLTWIYWAAPLHGVVVAGLILGAPYYVEAVVPDALRSTAQGVLGTAGMYAAGIASNLAAGLLIEHVGTPAPYLAGGLGALVLGAAVPWILPPPRRAELGAQEP